MKLKCYLLCALLLVSNRCLRAQSPSPDLLGESLFPPELVMNYQSEIGLTDEQRDSIMEEMQKAQPRFEELHQQLQRELEKMADFLKKERIEEPAALTQFDKVLNLEREIKRAHLALVIGLKNKLTSKQQAKLQEIKKQHASGRAPASLQAKMEAKMEKVKAGVEKWQNDGRDPSPIAEIMQEFEPLMKGGKVKEAEAVLDKALKLLRGSDTDKSDKPEKKQSAVTPPRFQSHAKANQTPDGLKAEIEALKDSKVAWRGIAWKSCLLEGLKESRETHKPLLLWVFIDRPADDQRC